MGFRQIYLHNVGPNQREFIDTFGEHVLPALKTR
jgi:coenzyme F420-dependent glucose-6-phosphate dehydrogenase